MNRVFRFARALVFSVFTLLMLAASLCAQEGLLSPPVPQFGVPEDWTTRHVIYTRNGSEQDMMAVRGDPRFLNSFLLHSMREHPLQLQPSASVGANETNPAGNKLGGERPANDPPESQLQLGNLPGPRPDRPRKSKNTKIDWAVPLGATYGMAIGETPAKYTFNPNSAPSCTDFIVLSLKAPPAVNGQANLVGLTNLYSGTNPTGLCGNAPTFMFSYAIGSGRSYLSPVLSLTGKKVAWVETSSASRAVLHVTTFVAGQGASATAAVAPTGVFSGGACSPAGSSCDVAIDYTNSAFPGCAASAAANTNSEIYVDYASDTAFVGADNGILYHVTGIFNGTPAVNFCVVVNATAGTALSGGVYDPVMNPAEFFIADSKKVYAYTVGAGSFTLTASYTYGAGTLTGPGPVLDAFNNLIYLFSANDIATPTAHTSVTQLATTLAPASAVVVPLGPVNTNSYPILFYGAFDNNYFTFGPKNVKSTLYSCGTDATTTTAQDLFAISFNSTTGVMNTTPAMPANAHVNPGGLNGTCSPITEFYDGTNDRIFVGMGQHLATTGANVVQMWNVNTQLTSAATTFTAQAANYLGGPSGMVIDNNASGVAQAESVYFTTLAANGTNPGICGANQFCAVKLTQSGLQ
jgi:hypothetical protein